MPEFTRRHLANHRERTHLDGESRGVFPDGITSSRPRVSLFFESYGRRSSWSARPLRSWPRLAPCRTRNTALGRGASKWISTPFGI